MLLSLKSGSHSHTLQKLLKIRAIGKVVFSSFIFLCFSEVLTDDQIMAIQSFIWIFYIYN